MIKTKNSQKRVSKLAALALGVLVFVGLSLAGYRVLNREQAASNTPMTAKGIDLSPATEEEKQQAENHKAAVEERVKQDRGVTAPATGKSVTPVISSWGQDLESKNFELAAYIAEVYENGGSCSLQLTMGSQTITKNITGRKDVNRTTCAPFVVPISELHAGDWTAKVTYTSSAASGRSNEQVITIK